MIRVIGGIYKGRRLKTVPSPLVRPIPDKLKESLFGILKDEVKGKSFLDGFAGTGSVGIEALSRGAKRVVFIEELLPAVKVIKINLARCAIEENFRILRKEFNHGVIELFRDGEKFDIIFLDPPYKLLEERNPLKVIKKRHILKPQGLVIIRHYYKIKFDPGYFERQRAVTIGDDTLSFFTP